MLYLVLVGVSIFLGFCGLADAIKQPTQAFRASGHSKPLWVLIELVGMLSIVGGAVTFLVYSYGGVRRDVVKAGGYNRPSSYSTTVREMTRSVDAERQAQQIWSGNAPQPCSSCNGRGTHPCYGCVNGYNRDGQNALVAHAACGSTGHTPCQMCLGTGRRS